MRDIQKLVRSLGIGGNYQGYRYLLYALSLCLQNEDYLLSVSKLLYPEIAHTYQTSASSVERNLRTVVSVCWERGNRPLLESISLCPLSSKPTIGEFLDILTEYLQKINRFQLYVSIFCGTNRLYLCHIFYFVKRFLRFFRFLLENQHISDIFGYYNKCQIVDKTSAISPS